MVISSKNVSIIIFATFVTITILSCFYIYKTVSSGYNLNQQIAPYGKNVIISDKNTLNNFTGTLYPVFKSLDDIMNDIITNKSNDKLYNMSLPLIDRAIEIDSGKKGLDDPYGLPKGIEEPKRVILDEIINEFKIKNC